MPLEKGKYVGKDKVFKWLAELVRSIEIILMGDRREGAPLLTPGEVFRHMALRVRQGEWGSFRDNSALLLSALLSLEGYWE